MAPHRHPHEHMVKISIQHIEDCRLNRPVGYADALIEAGDIQGDWLLIEKDALEAIVKKFTPERLQSVKGLGDLVHKIANPIARAIDSVAGTNIQGCGGCAKRREQLNKAIPIK